MMTRITGTVVDIAGRTADGILTISAPALRHDAAGNVVDRIRVDIGISGGAIAPHSLDPGPARLMLDTRGGWQEFEVNIPDVPEVDLYDLVRDYVHYDPPIVSEVAEYARRAEAAADASEQGTVADGAVSLPKLADDVRSTLESAARLPEGGSDGQVLAKSGSGLAWIDPPTGGGGGGVDGPLAAASPTYKAAALAAKAGTGQLRVLTIGDSTCDGFSGGLPGGPSAWSQTWPILFAARLRTAWGLPAGGVGWIPLQREGADPTDYSYPIPTSSTGSWAPIVGDTGVTGSQWMVPPDDGGHAISVPLEPGVSSVEALSTSSGGDYWVGLVRPDDTEEWAQHGVDGVGRTALPNPGAAVRVESFGAGWQALGVVAYAGDESRGVVPYNWGTAGLAAHVVDGYLGETVAQAVLGELAPHVVLICLGANDVESRTAAQVRASFSSIHSKITSAVPGAAVVFTVRDLPDAGWDVFADAIVAEAAVVGAHALDMRTHVPSSTAGAYVSDGVHLTASGNSLYASVVADVMRVASPAGGGGGGVTVAESEPGSGLFTITAGGAPALVETEPGSGLYTIGG